MSEEGFTLAELLIALMIFGMLSAAGVALLSFSVRAQDVAAERLDDVAAIRRAGALLTADLAQAVDRPVRDEDGETRAAFRGSTGEGETLSLAFVRRGWENPDGTARPSLQKVEYGLVEGRLQRRAYRFLDGAQAQAPVTLRQNVERLRLRYRDGRGAWVERWSGGRGGALPVAVEFVIDLRGQGSVRQLFLAGAQA